ncbi:hypothetical protein RND71_024769 [Anisodus tanguticus]|uniref:Uncharacterized protein n=1 Tax=Anisodus tanguticus TaxID=243964 RepID=A0AAE1RQ61_9SOLA|nr:hypothetical protein RND71_024769 [Anisodus tanguticus]
MAKISRLLGSTIKAAITTQAGFHAKHIPAVSSLQEHIFKTTQARYNSTQASVENDISGTDNKGFKGHDMLAPFTAGWQSTDVDPLIIEKSEGSYVYDNKGRKYLDTLAGLWCTALGGNEPRLVEAATKQLNTLPFYHSFWNRTTKPSLDLAKELLDMFTAKKMAKAFFTNSGSEANDTQVKLVWYYNNALGRPNKKKFIARAKAYHGSTLISASETEEEFSTRLAKNLEDLILKEGPDTIAAFIAEPVMGAGGVIPPPATYFDKIQAVVKKYDILFIADEVICAFGRLGTMFGCDKYNIKPDLVSLAKVVYDIGLDNQENKREARERNMVERVNSISPKFQEGLKAFSDSPIVGEIRGTGLILATEFADNKSPNDPFPPEWGIGAYFGAQCEKNGMLVRVAGDTIMMSPPFIATPEELDELISIYGKALRETEKRVAELKSQK